MWLTLHGEIKDPEFLRFLEEIGHERLVTSDLDDMLVIDRPSRKQAAGGVG